jgi:RNA polymerase sigma-70 factor (ECF subfamily)
MDGAQAAVMLALGEEHTAALWRHALRLTVERPRAEHVVQETVVRARQHPQRADARPRRLGTGRATVARHVIVDEGRAR